jgi:shikimate kinase
MEGPIVLIGPMGSGKSAVGLSLAKRLDWGHIDIDQKVESLMEMSIRDIFNNLGENVFRDMESQIFKEAISEKNAVISCGGGIVTSNENLEILHSMKNVIFLIAEVDALVSRLNSDSSRPLLEGFDKKERLGEILEERMELYLYAADMVIDTTGLDVEEVVDILNDTW